MCSECDILHPKPCAGHAKQSEGPLESRRGPQKYSSDSEADIGALIDETLRQAPPMGTGCKYLPVRSMAASLLPQVPIGGASLNISGYSIIFMVVKYG